jgi:hypothetical protein
VGRWWGVSIGADLAEAYSEVFDVKRGVFVGESAKLLLLKMDGTTRPYAVVEQVDTGWTAEFSDFFGSTTFKVADISAAFASKVNETAFLVVVDCDNEALEGQLHAVNRETTRPAGVDPFWRIRATATGKRYVPA